MWQAQEIGGANQQKIQENMITLGLCQLPGACDVDDILFEEVSRTCANTKPRAEPIGWSQVRILQFSKTRSSLALWHYEGLY